MRKASKAAWVLLLFMAIGGLLIGLSFTIHRPNGMLVLQYVGSIIIAVALVFLWLWYKE